MANGRFIVVDGIDGSGKSEIIKRLHNYLFSKNKRFRILSTREPTYGKYGNEIRGMLKNESDPLSNREKLKELFVKDREEHLKNSIEPFLDNSTGDEVNIVLCDRYYYSTIAFQGAQGFDMKELAEMNKNFRKPDIAFILDSDPELALKRIEHRKKEKFEQLQFMKKIRENFLKLPEMLEDNIKMMDSNKNLNEVFADLRKEIDKAIK